MSHDNLLVRKPWGWEACAFDNGHCAIWVLHIARKRATSRHCHPNKRTQLIVLQGVVEVNGQRLEPLGSVDIPKGEYHRTEAVGESSVYPPCEDGAFVLEIEWPANKEDLVRAEDEYGRVGFGYEGAEHTLPAPKSILRLTDGTQRAMGCVFTITDHRKICIVGTETDDIPLGDGRFLTITKDNTVKVSDYVADFVASLGVKHVFSVAGGGSMHLVDSFGNHKDIQYVACHHEQAAAMAAESYSRLNGLGCCLVTTGPGGTNALTGVACAWVDSIPLLVISGQVTRDTLLGGHGLRQFGVQETDIETLVTPITKYAVTVRSEQEVQRQLQYAVSIAKSGRPGPVWVDIPLDLQSKRIVPNQNLMTFGTIGERWSLGAPLISEVLAMLREAKRPVLIVGNGVRLAGAVDQLRHLIDALGIPVVSSWTGGDIVADHPLHIGHSGIFGDRASNFAVQNADLLLILGSRMSVPQTGYNFRYFAREAKIIMVDVDHHEIEKPSLHVDLPVVCDVKWFIKKLLGAVGQWRNMPVNFSWIDQCQEWREKYPVVLPEYSETKDGIHSHYFIDELCKRLPKDAVVVLDMGSAFTGTYQAAKMKYGQRWITASGHAPMGYGLPGAVGAAFATGKRVICITGDGGLQMNIQELATIRHHNLPITIFVLQNNGYLTIKIMQANHFNKKIGSDPESGLTCPNIMAIGGAYDILHICCLNAQRLENEWPPLLDATGGPVICEIVMNPTQALIPRLASKKLPDGSITSTGIEDLFPFLPRDEFLANMIVQPIDVLSSK